MRLPVNTNRILICLQWRVQSKEERSVTAGCYLLLLIWTTIHAVKINIFSTDDRPLHPSVWIRHCLFQSIHITSDYVLAYSLTNLFELLTVPAISNFLPRCMQCRRGLAMRILSVRPSVRPSVCLSVTRVHCNKTVERSVQIYIPYERTFIPLLCELEWLTGGDPFYVKFWVNRPPLERNRRFSTNNRS